LLAVVIVALPMASKPAVAPVPSNANVAALASARPTAEPTIGPHGDDVATATEPPVDRSFMPTRAPRPPSLLSGYRWPIRNARITNGFGKGYPGGFVIDGVTAHDGLDLATWCGDRIVAAHAGIVLSAGRHHEGEVGWLGDLTAYRTKLDTDNAWRSRAIAVVIDDGNGYRSLYVHLAKVNVKAGDLVDAGDLIGWEGQTGNATGCHLHYGLFSPDETDSWQLDPETQQRNLLPEREIARIDPFLVMPPIDAAGISWGWGVTPED